ncbi:MAG: NifB/NifX family molybdenum-iron cluster-binding protein [Candidatus Nanopelagicales bacterium]
MTRVCIPTMGYAGMDDHLCEHFGRAGTYTFVDSITGEVEVIQNTTLHLGGAGFPPDLISEHGGEVLICSAVGRRAVGMFDDQGIKVFVGASGSVKNALKLWASGRLQPASRETVCQEHAYRGEHHDSGHHHHHG